MPISEITLLNQKNHLKFEKNINDIFPDNISTHAKPKNTLPEILFITSFPPRECGIATYSQDLINAINSQFENTFQCSICALESENEQHIYKHKPKYILNTDEKNSFTKTAFIINKDNNIKLVIMQHEFGFFVEKNIEYKMFFEHIIKPIVFVFHTVLPNPNTDIRTKVQDMANIASSIIVMTKNAQNILIQDYQVPLYKITIIPHGTHLVSPLDKRKYKINYQLLNKKVLSTFGLLSSSKSIETTLNALPEVIKSHPEVLFLILGKTHPTIVKQEGEKYRNMLEEKVISLNIQNHVRFLNEYLQLPVLLEYLQVSDIYLFTSKDPNQAVSGTFSYAVSAGCPVISTPIPHAKEVLNNNNGIIIDFENSAQLSKAIISLLDNNKLRKEISLNSIHKMASTAWQNSAIAHALLFKNLTSNNFELNFKIPKYNFIHIRKMTTNFAMLQFAKISTPDINSGYTLDDNARALIAICQYYKQYENKSDINLIQTYLQFIKYCLQTNGKFLNYVNVEKKFTEQNFTENLEDSNGRAIWALGFLISIKKILPPEIGIEAEKIMQKATPSLLTIYSSRAMAFILKGLYYENKMENIYLIKILADRLVKMYEHEKTNDWQWFENYMTYGNSVLPEGLLCAYLSTKKIEYKKIAYESFNFLLSKIFIDNKIKVISNQGWHIKNNETETKAGGEQPIDVAYTIMALEKFYSVYKKDTYLQKTIIAFNWFLGNNHLNQIVYNPCTGGCYDGVENNNVNLNQGAESSISYLLAKLAIDRITAEKSEVYLLTNKETYLTIQ
jgi:glycosyltransferase involved in cell wall biosynthesis